MELAAPLLPGSDVNDGNDRLPKEEHRQTLPSQVKWQESSLNDACFDFGVRVHISRRGVGGG